MNGNAKEYALAIFAVALENDSMASIHDDLLMIRDVFEQNPDYIGFLVNPAVPKSERSESIKAAFEENVNEDVFAFINILCDHGDMYKLMSAIEEFNVMYDNYMKFTKAVITSAVELTDEEKVKLVSKLEKVTSKRIEAEYVIDKSIIGGITVDVDGKFYDGSVRKNFNNLKEVIS